MTQYNNLLLSTDNQYLTITINRQDKHNALNLETLKEINNAFDDLDKTKDVKGVIITGAGEKSFVSGFDISEFIQLGKEGKKIAKFGQDVFFKIEECRVPVIALVNGYAFGGGCELAMACHMRVATENALFGQPEVKIGIIPGFGGTQRLTQLIGKGRSIEMIMTGDPIDAKTALHWGLANYVEKNITDAQSKIKSILDKISLKAAPIAISHINQCVNSVYSHNGYFTELTQFEKCCQTQDFKEGVNAFLQKRKAEFIAQ